MRPDEDGDNVPSTLGEYRALCASLGGEQCEAVAFLDGRIAKAEKGADEPVIMPDSQVRLLLVPMLYAKAPV